MRFKGNRNSVLSRLSLTHQVALLSLVPIVALGVVLARVLQEQIVNRTLADASQSAQIIAHVAVQPRLSPRDMNVGLTSAGINALDQQLSRRSVTQDLARIKIWNAHYRVIYSDDHALIGRTLTPSDDLLNALAGRPDDAEVVNPSPHSETASEVGLGQLVEVYVPLRFKATGPAVGAFEIYLSYRPIAAAITHDKREIVLLVALGLSLLWLILYRIVARASRNLRRQADENYRLAHYDQLTGLPNRNLLIERLATAAREARSTPTKVAVLVLDLDGFTAINNTLGDANGDLVLGEIARRLNGPVAAAALAARVGGDEYAVLLPEVVDANEALQVAEAIQRSLEEPIALDVVALNVEASIGVAVMGEHAADPAVLLQRADAALAHARARCSRIEVYSAACDQFDATRLKLLGEVRGALEQGQFILHYQPQIDLRSGRISGVEALVRWQHPEHGLLSPQAFIPLVEQTALVGALTLHVIDQALAQAARWRNGGIGVQMSANLSARNLLDPELPSQVAGLLRKHAVPAQQLTLEVTESAAMVDPDRAVAVLEALRALGVGVSVDDFGTGNASIEYLAKLPATELKIDRSFITDILNDRRADAIARSTIDLARNLELTVVAEGIETGAVLEYLATLGCDRAQGYFISRPLPAEELTARLSASFAVGKALAGKPAPAAKQVNNVEGVQGVPV